jgi:hypothetical protein
MRLINKPTVYAHQRGHPGVGGAGDVDAEVVEVGGHRVLPSVVGFCDSSVFELKPI